MARQPRLKALIWVPGGQLHVNGGKLLSTAEIGADGGLIDQAPGNSGSTATLATMRLN
jgi:hypothetical protein